MDRGGMRWLVGAGLLVSMVNCGGKAEDDRRRDAAAGGSGGAINEGVGGADGGSVQTNTGGQTLVEDTTPIGQVDLLFVVDNSLAMADKHQLLARAATEMVGRLVNPHCVSGAGEMTPASDGSCPAGFAREFAPIDDIHIGVITSSLGGQGSDSCPRATPGQDDRGWLMPAVRSGLTSELQGFLAWNGGDAAAREALLDNFVLHVEAAGERGCGFEAPLEAWYRFLVDPQPPEEIVIANSRATMRDNLVDVQVLAQREAFLRPQSLVNIIVLTDENDCSMMSGGSYYENAGFGYLVGHPTFQMPVATSACEDNPNDRCCFSCLQAGAAPSGCSVADCNDGATIPSPENRLNMRCFEQKRRFGVDLLYPTERYVKALLDREIIDARSGAWVQNPLLMGVGPHAGTVRPHGRVYFTGIVGVPWQDIATAESLSDPDTFEYLTATELGVPFNLNGEQVSRWDVILGSRGLAVSSAACQGATPPTACGQAPIPPLDPFMIESIVPRQYGAANPISGDVIVDFSSNNPRANQINGHEVNHQVATIDGPANDDLQYACIFALETPKEHCTVDDFSCDCGDEPLRNSPLCQPPAGGPAATTQYFAKAYPGIRILEVLRDFGGNAQVGSICPKSLELGYAPVFSAVVNRMKERFP